LGYNKIIDNNNRRNLSGLAIQKELKVFIASSVGIDYFFFLEKIIGSNGITVEPIYLIKEKDYRSLAQKKGFKKIYLRIKMYIFYPLYLIYKAVLCPSESVFIVTSNTFYAPFLTKIVVCWKKTKVFQLLYDLFPDAIEVSGSIRFNGFLSKTIGLISINNFKYCDGTIFLGAYLKQHASNRWCKPKHAEVIHISTDLSLYDEEFSEIQEFEKIIIHYGGQLGHLHDAKSIISCIKYILKSDLKGKFEFNFYVSGFQAIYLEESLENYPVKIIPAVASNIWRRDIKNYHIGLVSLSPGGASVCLPSKTYGMMAGGLSILAICPVWSDLAHLVNSNDAGWIVPNSPYEQLPSINNEINTYLKKINTLRNIEEIKMDFYQTLKNIYENIGDLKEKRKNAFNNVRNKYKKNVLEGQWKAFIKNTTHC